MESSKQALKIEGVYFIGLLNCVHLFCSVRVETPATFRGGRSPVLGLERMDMVYVRGNPFG
jgi:hypothetical protein